MSEATPTKKRARKPRLTRWPIGYVRELIFDYLTETGPRTTWEIIQCFTSNGWSVPELTLVRALLCMDMDGELVLREQGLMVVDKCVVEEFDQPDLFKR